MPMSFTDQFFIVSFIGFGSTFDLALICSKTHRSSKFDPSVLIRKIGDDWIRASAIKLSGVSFLLFKHVVSVLDTCHLHA